MAGVSRELGFEVRSAEGQLVLTDFEFWKAAYPAGKAHDSGVIVEVGQYRFAAEVYPNGQGEAGGWVSLFLRRADSTPGVALVRREFRVVNQRNHADRVFPTEAFEFGTPPVTWGLKHFLAHRELEDEAKGFRVGDRIVIKVRVEVSVGVRNTVECTPAEPPRYSAKVANDYLGLLERGEGADLILEIGTETIPVHFSILGCRSPVFHRMFATKMLEAETRRAKLADVEPAVAWSLLRFVYTGELDPAVSDDEDALCHLLSAASKYQIDDLLQACETRISSRLCIETVADRLALADMVGARSLRESALGFVTRSLETLVAVQQTEAFSRIASRPELLRELLAVSSGARPQSSALKRSAEGLREFPEGTDWARLTVTQLQRACRERSLRATGTKGDLQRRLEDFHRAGDSVMQALPGIATASV